MRSTKPGHCEGVIGKISGDDARGARVAGHQNTQRTDGATAGDQNGFACQIPSLRHGVQANGKGFRHGGLRRRQAIGWGALGRADDEIFLKGTLDMRKGHRAAVKAHV
jgi:hypothetical protein